MDLDDLKESPPTAMDELVKRIADRKAARLAEDEAIAANKCVKCGFLLNKEVSTYGTDVIYYSCTNPDMKLGHCYIRTIKK